ncbi:MAG: type VII secretion integral membrane protein EccD [Kineosporiaceae bacterium]
MTVVAPNTRMDVALPADVPLADLVPTLLRSLGEDVADVAPPSGGWSLQRFGEGPFDLGASAAALSVRDGELLYLRPQQAELPEMAFDDVSDAIATAVGRGTRWGLPDTRRAGMSLALAALGATALVILGAGPGWLTPALLAGTVTVALTSTAAVMSRALSDAAAGATLGYAAVGYAALTGLTAFAGHADLAHLGVPSLLGASALALVVAVGLALAVADNVPHFVGVAVVAAFILVTGLLAELAALQAGGAAAVTLVLTLGLVQAVPTLALRMAELPLPSIPFTAEDVRNDDSVVGVDVLRRTVTADRYVTALLTAVAVVSVGAEVVLAAEQRASSNWMLAVTATVMALRARVFTGRVQRGSLLVGSAAGVTLLTVSGLHGVPAQLRVLAVAIPLLIAAAVLVAVALRWHGNRVSPVWRRSADILDAIAVTAVIPVALSVLGLYGFVRGYVS